MIICNLDNFKSFYDIVNEVYKNISNSEYPINFYVFKDMLMEYVVEKDIKEMTFEGMLIDSDSLLNYYLVAALDNNNLSYAYEGKIFNDNTKVIFSELAIKNIAPIRR